MQTSSVHVEASSRGGRPRSSHIDAALIDATFDVLYEHGYNRLTLEEVARRAGTTKPALYRRWPSRQHLVLAALTRQLGEVQAPDTECTLCDISECLSLFVRAFECIPPDVIGPLLADCSGDPELRAEFMSALFDPPRAAVDQTLTRALERGDLRADLDRQLTLDLLGSLVHYRALFGHATTGDSDIESAVVTLMQGIATDYQRLLEHARQESSTSQVHHLHADDAGGRPAETSQRLTTPGSGRARRRFR